METQKTPRYLDALLPLDADAVNLARREEQLALILEGVQDHAITLLDPDGAIVTWNAPSERITGYPLEEVHGKHFRFLFVEEEQLGRVPEQELEIARATGKFAGEGYRLRKDGSRFFANVSLSALHDENGNLRGFVKVTHDITERVNAQRHVDTLSEASEALVAHLDQPTMIARFERRLSGRFANYVAVEFLGDGKAWHGPIAHADPRIEASIRAIRESTKPDFTVYPLSESLERSEPVVLDSSAVNFGISPVSNPCRRGAMVLRLEARGKTFGELIFVRSSFGFDAREVELGQELARRLALAIDSARLFERAQRGEQRLHLALEGGMMGVWEWEIGANRVNWSPTLESIHGIAPGSFAGTVEAFQSDIHPMDRDRVLQAIRQTMECGSPYQVVYRIVRPDGQTRWLEAHATLTREPITERPLRLVGVCSDVTERKRREEELAESELRFKALFDNALDAMVIMDTEQVIVDVNPAACTLLRTTRDALLGRRTTELMAASQAPEMEPERWENFLREGSLRGEMRVVRADGTFADIEFSTTAHVVPNRHFSVWSDIGPRKRAEGIFAFLAEASTILSSSLDFERSISAIVRLAVPAMADWAAADLLLPDGTIGRLAVAHVDPDRIELARELWRRWPAKSDDPSGVPAVIRTGTSQVYPEISEELLRELVKDDELLGIVRKLGLKAAMCVPLVVRGKAIGAISFVIAESGRQYGPVDLSLAEDLARRAAIAIENARLYESEQKARRQADEANRAKDDFLATLSHELRTPLNAMLGWASILRSGDIAPEKQRRALDTIERNALTQAKLIEDLLDISRIVSGKLNLEPRPLEPTRLVEAVMETLRPTAEVKNIALRTSYESDIGWIQGDGRRLQQVIGNLLSNAVKFTPAGGSIDVRLHRCGSNVALSFKDTGCGIEPEFLSQVFERFKQADTNISRKQRGLGIGLAISKHIVELHGGSIVAHSLGSGTGATFTVFLPSSAIKHESNSARVSAATTDGGDPCAELVGLSVLLVEDERDSRELAVTVLSECGATVYTAANASEALTQLRDKSPDVVVSDIGLPGEDGYGLIRKIRALPSDAGANVPAAALTAYARAEDRRKALDAGYAFHLSKPVEPARLIAIVSKLGRMARHSSS